MKLILVVNAGSSSLKYEVFEAEDAKLTSIADGLVERIGEASGIITKKLNTAQTQNKVKDELPIPDHRAGLSLVLAHLGDNGLLEGIVGVGHRMVHGGEAITDPTIVTPEVIQTLDDLADLAPLHNPPCLTGVRAAMELCPDVPHVVVLDTGFHATMEPEAYRYAVPEKWYRENMVRRYGFHGTSHMYVSEKVHEVLGLDVNNSKVITAHLGNGGSMAAILNGKVIDTSMGLTPLEGLVMGTRSGDIDPAIIFHMVRQGMTVDEVENALNRQSGLKGLCDENDARAIEERAEAGDESAQLALAIAARRIRGYIGQYMAHLGGLDALVFTAGIGENSNTMRANVVGPLAHFGLALDEDLNNSRDLEAGYRVISTGPVKVVVIATQEQEMIAREVLAKL